MQSVIAPATTTYYVPWQWWEQLSAVAKAKAIEHAVELDYRDSHWLKATFEDGGAWGRSMDFELELLSIDAEYGSWYTPGVSS